MNCKTEFGDTWRDQFGFFHRVGGPAIIFNSGQQNYYRHGALHRLDGPAVVYENGDVGYWVNGEIPFSILDIIIIREEIDFEMFPSAVLMPEVKYIINSIRAYRISDPDELVLAILRYS